MNKVKLRPDLATPDFLAVWKVDPKRTYTVKKCLFRNGEVHYRFTSGEEFPAIFFEEEEN